MLKKHEEGIDWLEFELLAEIPTIKHAVFLRRGGYSTGNYASLNLSFTVGDDSSNVLNNHQKIKKVLGLPAIKWGKQNHQDQVLDADAAFDVDTLCDGLTCSTKNLGIMVHHADCQAAIFYDPIQHKIANVHCGWRGHVKNIYAKCIQSMQAKFGSKPENLLVCISPSLGPYHFEFVNFREQLPRPFWDFEWKENFFDFWSLAKWQLMHSGILSHHIQLAEMCTYGNPQDCYSYRYSKIRGGHGTVIALL